MFTKLKLLQQIYLFQYDIKYKIYKNYNLTPYLNTITNIKNRQTVKKKI